MSDSLGQNTWLNHWLRITPRLGLGKTLLLVGQMDVVTGLVAGNTTHDVWADQTPRDSHDGFQQRAAALALRRLDHAGRPRSASGRCSNHWRMGLVANDGDHPSLFFGDYRYGSIGDGILFGTKPLGKDGPLTVALGGQYVFKDPLVDLSRGDRCGTQAILAA